MDVGWYYMNGPTIHNGEELDFYIKYFKEGALDGSGLVIGEDINEWTEEQLQELKYVEGEVNINGTGETLSIKFFGYLTGAEELILDGTGVSGEFVPVSVLTESLVVSDEVLAEMEVPEDTEVWEYEERIYYDGEWEEVQRFMVAGGQEGKKEYPEAYYKFWEPDSYFGNRH